MTIETFSTQQVFSRNLKVQTARSHVTKPMQSCLKFSNECRTLRFLLKTCWVLNVSIVINCPQ